MNVSRKSRQQQHPPSSMDPLLRMIAPGSARSSNNPSSNTSSQSNSRPASINEVVANTSNRNNKRLSINLPVQPVDITSSARITPTTSEPPSTSLPAIQSAALLPTKEPADFMVTLATQERRVLELREELNRAEAQLVKLKKQWAHHEASRKRSELRSTEQKLRPVKNNTQPAELQADEEPEDLMLRRGVELDKRRALLLGLSKDSRRTVISGGHTRALSLLSPDRLNTAQSPNLQSLNGLQSPNIDNKRTSLEKSSVGAPINRLDPRVRHSYQETGQYPSTATPGLKDIAEDIRAGLWNFMDDLRQATIGQEALETPPKKINKKPSNLDISTTTLTTSRQSPTSRTNSTDYQAPLVVRPKTPPNKPKKEEQPLINIYTPKKKTDSALAGLDDDWGNWDSPLSIRSIGGTYVDTDKSPTSPNHIRSTPKPLPLASDQEIPWPKMEDFPRDGVNGIKRTASAIMKEWERSLTSSPNRGEEEEDARMGWGMP